MKTPSGKQTFQIGSPINDIDIFKQLEQFRCDNDSMLDYVKVRLDKSPGNELLNQDGDWDDLQILATATHKLSTICQIFHVSNFDIVCSEPRKCWNRKWFFIRFRAQYRCLDYHFEDFLVLPETLTWTLNMI